MSFSYDVALSFTMADQDLVETVYHYLKGAGFTVFFAPSPEAQQVLSGKNQREVFFRVFGMDSKYVALFVSREYVKRRVPMEEANIAMTTHAEGARVIPIYLDGTRLPPEMLNPDETNYFRSSNAAAIAEHIRGRIKRDRAAQQENRRPEVDSGNTMIVSGNIGERQTFTQNRYKTQKDKKDG